MAFKYTETNVRYTFSDLGEGAEKQAMLFQAFLGADKGVPSEVQPIEGGYAVVADDGQTIHFLR
jgi:hypothetical protein